MVISPKLIFLKKSIDYTTLEINSAFTMDSAPAARTAVAKYQEKATRGGVINVTAGGSDEERRELADALCVLLPGYTVKPVTLQEEREATYRSVLEDIKKMSDQHGTAIVIVAMGISTCQVITSEKGDGRSFGYGNLTPEQFCKMLEEMLEETDYSIVLAGAPTRTVDFGEQKWMSVNVDKLLPLCSTKLDARAHHIVPYIEKIPDVVVTLGNPKLKGVSYVSDWALEEGTSCKFSGGDANKLAKAFGVTVQDLPQAIRTYVASQ